MKTKIYSLVLSVILLPWLFWVSVKAQQVADTAFKPPITKPEFAAGRGPTVLVDEAHFNFHTVSGRYLPFADFLSRDGYVVKASTAKFSKAYLKNGQILVIANALAERNRQDWSLPTPSAFSDEEVKAVGDWVNDGGALLLIVDHMPFPGAAENLAAAFGIRFSNGYALNEQAPGPFVFKLADGSLKDHAITRGRNTAEKVDSVATFTGSAFQVDGAVQPLFVLGSPVVSVLTSVSGQFNAQLARVPVKDWYQGAVLRFGKGRIAVFGEAAMFSAQLAGANRNPMGMNAPIASQNPQFLLNVMHWLSGRLENPTNSK